MCIIHYGDTFSFWRSRALQKDNLRNQILRPFCGNINRENQLFAMFQFRFHATFDIQSSSDKEADH